MAQIDITNAIIQSPNLYIQCSSSTQYRYGNYLRWELIGNKQNLLPTANNPIRLFMNKIDLEMHQYAKTTNLSVDARDYILDGSVRQWVYKDTGLVVNFPDTARYDTIKSSISDTSIDFILAYDDVIEMFLPNKLMFAVTLNIVTNNDFNSFKVETISAQRGEHFYTNEIISNRKSVTNITSAANSIF